MRLSGVRYISHARKALTLLSRPLSWAVRVVSPSCMRETPVSRRFTINHSAKGSARGCSLKAEFFVERCARCHNERGEKPLKTGPPLNERGLSTEVIARAVSGRLRDGTEDDAERRRFTFRA